MPTSTLETTIQSSLNEHKALDIICLDVQQATSITDFMFFCSATSNRHAQALADYLTDEVRAAHPGYTKPNIQGSEDAEWIVVDFADAIIHIMQPETRDYYQLEKLWRSYLNQHS